MDTLSHALWGKGLFGYRKYRWYSFLFGALPDLFLLAFISYTAYFSVPLQLWEDPQGLKYLSGCIAYMTFHIA